MQAKGTSASNVELHLYPFSRPKNYKELFNLRHAQARNVIERIFGILKKRFDVLVSTPEYGQLFQAKLVQALMVIHNFIRVHDPHDKPDLEDDEDEEDDDFGDLQSHVSRAERTRAAQRRDKIALAMWDDYKRVRRHRR